MRNFQGIKKTTVTAFRRTMILLLCASSLCLSGCDGAKDIARELGRRAARAEKSDDVTFPEESVIHFENEIKVFDTTGELVDTKKPVISEAEAEDNAEQMSAKNLPLIKDEVIFDGGSSTYAYSKLSESAKRTYDEIRTILEEYLDEVVLSTLDTDEIDLAFKAVMIDHPEIFYVKGYTLGKYLLNDELVKISFTGSYTMTKEEAEPKKKLVDEYVERALMNAPISDDYEKIKYVYEYLVANNSYDFSAPDNQNVLSVVQNGRTVCQGYAKMMQLMLSRLDIFCTLVNGIGISDDFESPSAHVWNLVECNGEYYHVDVTWGDSAFSLSDSSGNELPEIDINYEFMLVPDRLLEGTHEPKPVVELPPAVSMTDNYYVREGLYFSGVDDMKLRAAFDKAFSQGEKMLFLKTNNEMTLERLKEYLFDEQNVFEYTGQDNARFAILEDRNLIMITL